MQPNGLCRNPSIAPNAPIYAVGLLDADYGSLIKVIPREHPSGNGREKRGAPRKRPRLKSSRRNNLLLKVRKDIMRRPRSQTHHSPQAPDANTTSSNLQPRSQTHRSPQALGPSTNQPRRRARRPSPKPHAPNLISPIARAGAAPPGAPPACGRDSLLRPRPYVNPATPFHRSSLAIARQRGRPRARPHSHIWLLPISNSGQL